MWGSGQMLEQSRIGERVAIEPGIPDGICDQCRAGHYNLCPNVRFFGTPPIDGAFANYVTVPAQFAYTLPDNLSNEGRCDDRTAFSRSVGVSQSQTARR